MRTYAVVAASALALVVALVAASLLGAQESRAPAADSGRVAGTAEAARLLRGIPQDGNVLGSPDAPLTLAEYADVQCPYCARWARDAFPALVDEYVRPGLLRIEFRGMAFLGSDSRTALQMVLAAGEQNRLWNVLHLLFANQGHENAGWVTDDLLRAIGGSVAGLDPARMLEQRGSAAVERELVAAQRAADLDGVRGTPSFAAGETGGEFEPLVVSSLGPEEIRARLDELLDR